MARYNDVECFLYYMYNKWSLSESKHVFGDNLGLHVYEKWLEKHQYSKDVTMSWFSDLDKSCRDKIVERAKEIYSNNN